MAWQSKRRFVHSTLVVSVFYLTPLAASPAQETTQVTMPTAHAQDPPFVRIRSSEEARFRLSPEALQVARIIGVESNITRLSELTYSHNLSAVPSPTLEELMLRQRITDAIVVSSLDVDSVLEEMDYEQGQLVELRSILRARRDRAIGSTNIAALAAGTGLGIVGGLLQFSKATADTGNIIGFCSGGISTLFSLRSYRQTHSGERPSWVLPNMLAAFLGQTEERHSHYPKDAWAYISSVTPGEDSHLNRKAQVLAEWIEAGRLGPPNSPEAKQRIALLTSTTAANKKLDIELLNARLAMLADVRDEVAHMKHDLADLLRGLRP